MSEDAKTDNEPTMTVLGDVSPDVVQAITSLRQVSNDTVFRIGRLEVEKQRLMGQLSELENHASMMMEKEGQRLGIEPDVTWTITDGKAVVVKQGQ